MGLLWTQSQFPAPRLPSGPHKQLSKCRPACWPPELRPLMGGGRRAESYLQEATASDSHSPDSGCWEAPAAQPSHHRETTKSSRPAPSLRLMAGGQSVVGALGELSGPGYRGGAFCPPGPHMPEGLWPGPLPCRTQPPKQRARSLVKLSEIPCQLYGGNMPGQGSVPPRRWEGSTFWVGQSELGPVSVLSSSRARALSIDLSLSLLLARQQLF